MSLSDKFLGHIDIKVPSRTKKRKRALLFARTKKRVGDERRKEDLT